MLFLPAGNTERMLASAVSGSRSSHFPRRRVVPAETEHEPLEGGTLAGIYGAFVCLLLLVQSDSIGTLCLICAAVVMVCLAGVRGWIRAVCLITAATAESVALFNGLQPAVAAEGSSMRIPVILYAAYALIIIWQALRITVAPMDLYSRLTAGSLAAIAVCQLSI